MRSMRHEVVFRFRIGRTVAMACARDVTERPFAAVEAVRMLTPGTTKSAVSKFSRMYFISPNYDSSGDVATAAPMIFCKASFLRRA